jgi:copper chaperone CopZ
VTVSMDSPVADADIQAAVEEAGYEMAGVTPGR